MLAQGASDVVVVAEGCYHKFLRYRDCWASNSLTGIDTALKSHGHIVFM